jgi:ferredoxin
MVKDEDVCLHCGLCAERCPTGAWDMRRFLFAESYAGRGEDYSALPSKKKVAA